MDAVCRIFLSLSPGKDIETSQLKRSAKRDHRVTWLELGISPYYFIWLGLSRAPRFLQLNTQQYTHCHSFAARLSDHPILLCSLPWSLHLKPDYDNLCIM